MGTLIYAPGVEVHVSTRSGLIDLSDDISGVNVALNEGSPHKFTVEVVNHRRKYDGIFTPNDRVAIRMKRVRWLHVFSGYIDAVPYWSVHPRSVSLTGTCTGKRLVNTLYDPGSPAYVEFISQRLKPDDSSGWQEDGGMGTLVRDFLMEIADWPEGTIHIGRIPDGWRREVEAAYEAMAETLALSEDFLNGGGMIAGQGIPGALGSGTHPDVEGTKAHGIGRLPAASARIRRVTGGDFIDMNSSASLRGVLGSGPSHMRGPWSLMGRWGYASTRGAGGWFGGDGGDPVTLRKFLPDDTETQNRTKLQRAVRWWHGNGGRKLMVINAKNRKAVCVVAGGWGPIKGTAQYAANGRVLEHLGVKDNDSISVQWADDNIPLGPVDVSALTRAQDTMAGGSGGFLGSPSAGGAPPPIPLVDSGGGGGSVFARGVAGATSMARTAGTISGLSWTPAKIADRDSGTSVGHLVAAAQFIKANWPDVSGISGRRQGTGGSDHYTGHAIDITASQPSMNSIALWFVQNPNVFGIKTVIWRHADNRGQGWQYSDIYRPGVNVPGSGRDMEHINHVHLSGLPTQMNGPGPMGGAWPGSDTSDPHWRGVTIGQSGGGIPGGSPNTMAVGPDGMSAPGMGLLNSIELQRPSFDPLSTALLGPRRLMNTKPVLQGVRQFVEASMRVFATAPNGDFISWFPDHFNRYGTAGMMDVELIEVEDFSMAWTDENYKTHFFSVGSLPGEAINPFGGSSSDRFARMVETNGVASVEFEDILKIITGVNSKDDVWGSAEAILQRFGARPHTEMVDSLNSREAEFWHAMNAMAKNFAQQFRVTMPITFMPELFPGMILRLPELGIQFYIQQVSHDCSYRSGFTTRVTCIAPSTIGNAGKSKFYGQPNSGPLVTGGTGGYDLSGERLASWQVGDPVPEMAGPRRGDGGVGADGIPNLLRGPS